MDKSQKSFILMAGFLILCLFLILMGFIYVYHHSSISIYNGIFLVLTLMTVIAVLFFAFITGVVFSAYQKRHVSRPFIWSVRLALSVLMAITELLSALFRNNRDIIRSFCIAVNNILVQSNQSKYKPQQILVLLPHCLQNSECIYKVTSDVQNCKRCGKCCIGDIIDIAKKAGVNVQIATGGTAARNIISKSKPRLILSVACERDLASGIADVRTIPVIGIVNERPNGPCYNTNIDVEELKKMIDSVLSV